MRWAGLGTKKMLKIGEMWWRVSNVQYSPSLPRSCALFLRLYSGTWRGGPDGWDNAEIGRTTSSGESIGGHYCVLCPQLDVHAYVSLWLQPAPTLLRSSSTHLLPKTDHGAR